MRVWLYELLPHPPYSSNLVPSDLHLFPRLKEKHIWGQIFEDGDELTAAVEARWFSGPDVEFH